MGYIKNNFWKIVLLIVIIVLMVYFYNRSDLNLNINTSVDDYNTNEINSTNSSSYNVMNNFKLSIAPSTEIEASSIQRVVLNSKITGNLNFKGQVSIYSQDSRYVLNNDLILLPGNSLILDEPGRYYLYNYQNPSKSIHINLE